MGRASAFAGAATILLGLSAGILVAQSRRASSLQTALTAETATCLESSNGPVLSGYDVVAYFSLESGSDGVLGSAIYNATYGGYSFYFETAANRDLFEADPAAYAPQYGGFCSWGIAEESVWDKANMGPSADPDVWEIIDGKLYLFMFDKPHDKFMGLLTDDDLDASGSTAAYISDGDERWDGWYGDEVVFNTDCFWWDASSDTAEKTANQEEREDEAR